MTDQTLEITEARGGAALVLGLKGRLDAVTCTAAQESLLARIEQGHTHLALDFSQLEYISSAGLRVLLAVLKKLKSVNGKIVLFGFSNYIREIFNIAGFSALFPIYASAEEAMTAFRWNHPLAKFITASRSGANVGAYNGERIDIDALQDEMLRAARSHGWTIESILDEEGCRLWALSRLSPTASKSIYLSSGMHGDEPGPPLAVANLLSQNRWPADCNFYICTCLNPEGFRANQRLAPNGIDLNRDYFESKSRQIRAHIAWLEKQGPFSFAASLHEDWESAGFYAYHLGPLPVEEVIHHILQKVSPVCAIDQSRVIDYLPAEEGIVDLALHSLQMNEKLIDGMAEPSTDAPIPKHADSIWSEPVYLINRKTRVSYTFETPSAFPIEVRVQAMTQAVEALLSCPFEIY